MEFLKVVKDDGNAVVHGSDGFIVKLHELREELYIIKSLTKLARDLSSEWRVASSCSCF
jgi:hypothetical protein